MITGSQKSENKVQEIAAITKAVKQVARELDCPIVLLCQLNRNAETRQEKRPVLSDLRDSGSIEQDADIVGLLYREDYYKQDKSNLDNKAELIIAKNRNGPTGVAHLFFDKKLARFVDSQDSIYMP